MGFVEVTVALRNPQEPQRQREVSLLADTGAMYTLVSRPILEELGIRPLERRRFQAVEGTVFERDMGGL